MSTQFIYLAAAALFILSIKWMSQVRSSRRGNWAGSLAMVLAVAGTLAYTGITATTAGWVLGAIGLGALIGIPMAVFMPMTAVPTRPAARPPKACDSAVRWGTAVIGMKTAIGMPMMAPRPIAPPTQTAEVAVMPV